MTKIQYQGISDVRSLPQGDTIGGTVPGLPVGLTWNSSNNWIIDTTVAPYTALTTAQINAILAIPHGEFVDVTNVSVAAEHSIIYPGYTGSFNPNLPFVMGGTPKTPISEVYGAQINGGMPSWDGSKWNFTSPSGGAADAELLHPPNGELAAYNYIQAALNNGGTYRLPGGVYVLPQPFQFPNPETWLVSAGGQVQPTSDTRGTLLTAGMTAQQKLTYLVPGSDFAQGTAGQSALIYSLADNCGVRGINFVTYGGGVVGYIVYADNGDFDMDFCSWQGPTTGSMIYISANVNRGNILHCYGNCQANGNNVKNIDWNGVDGKIIDTRTKGGIKYINGGNMVIAGGHWTGGNDILLTDGAATVHVFGLLYDTPTGTPGTNGAVRHNSSGRLNLVAAGFYTQGTAGLDAIVKSGSGPVSVVGGICWGSSGSNMWGSMGRGMGAGDQVVGVQVAGPTVSALWADSGPAHYDVVYNGIHHTEVSDAGQGVASLSPVPSATAATYGAFVNATLPSKATNYALVAATWTPNGVAGETITINIKATFSDGTTQTIAPAAQTGTTGQTIINATVMMSLAKNGTWLTGLSVQAKSSIASSTATPLVQFITIPVS